MIAHDSEKKRVQHSEDEEPAVPATNGSSPHLPFEARPFEVQTSGISFTCFQRVYMLHV